MTHLTGKKSGLILILLTLSFYSGISQLNDFSVPGTGIETIRSSSGLFDNEGIINVSLKFDITEYMRNKPDDDYMDAVITLYNDPDDSVSYDIKLRARGFSRLQLCGFPPVRLNFKNTATIYGDIDSMKNVKMVTHCNRTNVYDEYLIKEYLAYKLYNMISPYSFRVRLLNVKYIDTGLRGRFFHRNAFLIEPVDLLEQRLDVHEIENVPLRFTDMQDDILLRMAIFQYMIGNTDWQVASYHNIKVIKGREQLKGIPVPYDFDYSGFVNASYAIPAEIYGTDNVRQRIFLGPCRSDSAYARILEEFMDNRDNFYDLIINNELLTESTKKYLSRYLDQFFRLYRRDRIIDILKMECKD